jgi:hypothetical protein
VEERDPDKYMNLLAGLDAIIAAKQARPDPNFEPADISGKHPIAETGDPFDDR